MHANLSSETSCSKKLNGLLYYCPKLHTHFLLMQSLLTFKKVQSLKHTLKFLLISNTGWMDKHLFRNIEKFSDKHSLRETESGFTPPSMSEPVNKLFFYFVSILSQKFPNWSSHNHSYTSIISLCKMWPSLFLHKHSFLLSTPNARKRITQFCRMVHFRPSLAVFSNPRSSVNRGNTTQCGETGF